jgi:DNA-directed RNA polymerase specialized sigma subunit
LCEKEGFGGALAKYRTGDEQAGRKIIGSYLRLALALAESKAQETGEPLPIALLEEANAGLTDALASFTGSDSQEFRCHAEEAIRCRLASFSSLN